MNYIKIEQKTLRALLLTPKTDKINFNSHLVMRIEQVIDKKISDLTESDIRLLVNQSFGLEYVIPLAINLLEEDLFLESDFYEGDLLLNLISIDNTYWKKHRDQWEKLHKTLTNQFNNIHQIIFDDSIKTDLIEKHDNFMKIIF